MALLSGTDCGAGAITEAATKEETGGIYDIQSCENRCTETESKFENGLFDALNSDPHRTKPIEVCDCHSDCSNLKTCCPDYPLKCGESKNFELLWEFREKNRCRKFIGLFFSIVGYSTDSTEILTNYVATEKIPEIELNNLTKVPMPMAEVTTSKSLITTTVQPLVSDKNSTQSTIITNFVPNELKSASNAQHKQTMTQLSPSKSGNNHIWIPVACGLLFSFIFVTIIGWKHYQRKNSLSSHQITYKSKDQTHDLQIDFNGDEALLNEVAIEEEPNTNDSDSNQQNAKVKMSDKMRQHFRRSQQFLCQYGNLNDQKH